MIGRSRLYRGAALSLFLAGLGMSATLPQISLFLVDDLGAPLPVAGWYYLTNLSAPIAGFLIGAASDRQRDRLLLFRLGSVIGFLGWLAMAAATAVWVPFVLNFTVLAVSAATQSLLYAAVRDELARAPTGADNRMMSTIRMAFSIGFVCGPVVGSVLGDLLGLRTMLIATGVCSLAQLLPLIGVRSVREAPQVHARTGTAGPQQHRPGTGLGPLVAFLALIVLAMSGDTVKFAFLPLYMDNQLHTPDVIRGAVISTQSVGMLVFIPIAGALADRFGAQRVVAISVVAGVAANLGFMVSHHELGLFLATVLNAMMWSCIGGIGVLVAQSLHPTSLGLASSLYFSAMRFAAAVGGTVGGAGVGLLGVPGVFALPAILCAIAATGLIVQALRLRR